MQFTKKYFPHTVFILNNVEENIKFEKENQDYIEG
jgi:hypothetical protein